ncbi:MAG: metallophosphoesterase [Opitutaceae bacterium]|jgi:Icc-related predicted phosphoesterase
MRFLHVTDLHMRKPWYQWLSVNLMDYDACCITGDMLDMFPNAELSLHQQARWVRDWLGAQPGKIFLCTGNHDVWPESEHVIDNDSLGGWLKKARRPGHVFVDGDITVIEGYRFVCCPWGQAPTTIGPEPAIILVHAPPEGTPISSELGYEVGDPDVTNAVPSLPSGSIILSGHVHNPSRWHCILQHVWCCNPGVDTEAQIPNHIVIDTDARSARFHGWSRDLGPVRIL